MFRELENVEDKYRRLTLSLSDPSVLANPQKLREISKERSDMEPLVRKYADYKKIERQIRDSEVILAESGADEELRAMAETELTDLREKEERLSAELKILRLPKDPFDEKNVILEIRAGAGGDESSLFAQDLFRMYSRLAEKRGWQFEIMSTSVSPIGGFKEVVVNIRGKKVYSSLKYESGVHRVQRVPKTEAAGRIHTSTITVAVLPEADEVDIKLDPKDLRIEAFGASGPGGQNVNRNYTAIRITHVPSGMVASCQDEKSQHRNKEKALRILRSRLMDIAQSEQDAAIAKHRRSQVGTGERSEKIRTYNFPQSRVTDHRINLTSHNLQGMLDGDLDEFIENVILHFQKLELEELSSSAGE